MAANDIQQLLIDTDEITQKQAKIIATYVRPIENPRGPEARALLRSKRPGRDVTFRSVRPQNLIINWKELLVPGVELLAATGAAVTAPPIGIFVAIGLCLHALKTLTDVGSIDLSDDHCRVIEVLWRDFQDTNPVPSAELKRSLAGELDPNKLESILDDLALLQVIQFDEQERIIKCERIFTL